MFNIFTTCSAAYVLKEKKSKNIVRNFLIYILFNPEIYDNLIYYKKVNKNIYK
tara:strand:- start:272 stop:430 length:159 start_codon:yes stop_codon:yes gene_type:complete